MAQSVKTNRKKIMVPATMSKSGWALIEARDDVEGVEFVPNLPKAEFHKVLEEASGICLGVMPSATPSSTRHRASKSSRASASATTRSMCPP